MSLRYSLSNYSKTVLDAMLVATSVANFMSFPLAAFAYYTIANQIAQELGCGSFSAAFLDDVPCDELKKIGILDSGAGWVEGGIFSTVMVLSSSLGFIIGNINWLCEYFNSVPIDYSTLDLGNAGALKESLIEYDNTDNSQALPFVTTRQDWVQTIINFSRNAFYISRSLMLVGLLVGMPRMYTVGQKILTEFGCQEDFIVLSLWGPVDARTCNVASAYYAMTSFAYPWTFVTWLGYVGWMLAMSYQLLSDKIQQSFSSPFQSLINFFKSTIDSIILKLKVQPLFFQDLMNYISLWIKSSALATLLGSIYFVLRDGVRFSNGVLQQYDCPSFFTSLTSNRFVNDSYTCTPLTQILGVDAFPTKTEIYDAYPLITLVLMVATIMGVSTGYCLIKKTADREIFNNRINSYHYWLDSCIKTGKMSAILFFIPSAYALFYIAIPKANDLLERDGCIASRYPKFILDLFNTECSALSRYRANAGFVSTMWIFFSYSILSFFTTGVASHLAVQSSRVIFEKLKNFSFFNKRSKYKNLDIYETLQSSAHDTFRPYA